MGKRGPQPLPTEELERRRSWHAKKSERLNEIKVKPATDPPSPPKWLDGDSKREFSRIAKLLVAAKLITDIDADIIAQLAVALTQWRKLCDDSRCAEPVTYNQHGDAKRNPAMMARAEAQRDVVRLIRELGMSPASRVGLVLQKPGGDRAGTIIDWNGGFAT